MGNLIDVALHKGDSREKHGSTGGLNLEEASWTCGAQGQGSVFEGLF